MPFGLGSTAVGSLHGIRVSLAKPGASSISILETGKGNRSKILSLSSPPIKKTSIQAHPVSNLLCQRPLAEPCGLSTSICAKVLGPIWPAWDVHRAKIFGHYVKKNGIAPTDRLIAEVMGREPYKSAKRVFSIMDNCSAHRGQNAVDRILSRWPNALLVHTPAHASWINQIEIYFSIVQRKVLTPNDFSSLSQLEQCLMDFQMHYEQTASPFQWTFTRQDLCALLAKLRPRAAAAAAWRWSACCWPTHCCAPGRNWGQRAVEPEDGLVVRVVNCKNVLAAPDSWLRRA